MKTLSKTSRTSIHLDTETSQKIDILRTKEDAGKTFSKAGLVRKLVNQRIKRLGLTNEELA